MQFDFVIGYIDAYGAIHHQGLTADTQRRCHGDYWPGQTHKTWRFKISDWQLENSVLSKDKLTPAEAEDVESFIRRHYRPPVWVLTGEAWERRGRPHSGRAYRGYLRECARIEAAEAKRSRGA